MIKKFLMGFMFLAVVGMAMGEDNETSQSAKPAAKQPVTVVRVVETVPDDAVMSQRRFPCEEDQALMYHPSFGPDHVGCVNLDDVFTRK